MKETKTNSRIIIVGIIIVIAIGMSIMLTYRVVNSKKMFKGVDEKMVYKPNISENALPTIDTKENLLQIIKKSSSETNGDKYLDENGKSQTNDNKSNSLKDYSKTNIQVQGVDEGDIVKTDGTYIYKVIKRYNPKNYEYGVSIVKAVPAEKMSIVNTIQYMDVNFIPSQIYLQDKYMIVVGTSSKEETVSTNKKKPTILPKHEDTATTKAIIYDMSDISNAKVVKEVELSGWYLSSRKIGSYLYLISTKIVKPVEVQNQILPYYRDSVLGKGYKEIDLKTANYIPDENEPYFILIGTIDLKNIKNETKVYSCLGIGSNVYCSRENLYTGFNRYASTNFKKAITAIYKFSLNNGKPSFVALGKVKGRVINQFSMDEYEGNLRVATTDYDTIVGKSENNVFILDKNMKQIGSVEGLAIGEKIYSARFMDKMGYLVTYVNADPFFVLDLSNATSPKVVGQVKLPGYSTYLHPYDDKHIMGFGQDTVELVVKDNEGKPIKSTVSAGGFKMCMFDVTDITNPKEMFNVKIGDRGTNSLLINNAKALLYSKEKNIIAFPITIMLKKTNEGKNADLPFENTYFSYQGAYVYGVDLNKGFQFKGRITHIPADSKNNGYEVSNNSIQRIVYIGDYLYTTSYNKVIASKISDLSKVSEVDVP